MRILRATKDDADGIQALAERLLYGSIQSRSGSIVYTLPKDDLLWRIETSANVYVAKNDAIEGFLQCLNNEQLTEAIAQSRFYHNGIIPYLEQQRTPFVYGETIAVNPEMQRKGVGRMMMNTLFTDMAEQNILDMHVLIRHAPDRNTSSMQFCKELGFEFAKKEIQNRDAFTWGVYSKRA